MRVWVPDYYDARSLESRIGGNVRVAHFPERPSEAEDLGMVDLLVAPPDRGQVVDALPGMRSLRVVQTDSAGVDWIVDAVPAEVALCNARGIHDVPVAEWVVAVILAMLKRLPEGLELQRRARWEPWEPGELAGQRALIVGYGSIGRAVASRLRGLEVEVVGMGRTARADVRPASELPRLLPEADVVVLLTPLTRETRGLVDAGFLARMRPGALLVNAGRGGLVDRGALRDVLEAGRLRAALDVTDPEPLPADDPLWSAPGLLITPHVAGNSPKAIERASALIVEQVRRHRDGRPLLNVVEERSV